MKSKLFFILTLYLALVASAESLNTKRVVSLSPVITEIVFELGAENMLVGITDYCKKPKDSSKVRSVGSYLNTSIEAIYKLNPDLVILPEEQLGLEEKLNALNIKTLRVSNKNILKIDESINSIGNALGLKEKASILIEEKKKISEKIKQNCNFYSKKKVIFIFDEGVQESRSKYYIASTNSFYGDLLNNLGMNYAFESGREYAELSLEGIISLRPEFIFIVMDDLNSREGFVKKLDRFQAIPLIFLPKDPIVYPGPRYTEIAKLFCESR